METSNQNFPKSRIKPVAYSKFLNNYSLLQKIETTKRFIVELTGFGIHLFCAKTLRVLRTAFSNRSLVTELKIINERLIATVTLLKEMQILDILTLNRLSSKQMNERCKLAVREKDSKTQLFAIGMRKLYIYNISEDPKGILLAERTIDFGNNQLLINHYFCFHGNKVFFAEEHRLRIFNLESESWENISPNFEELAPGKEWYDFTEICVLEDQFIVYATYNGIISAFNINSKQHELVIEQSNEPGLVLVICTTTLKNQGKNCMIALMSNEKWILISPNEQHKLLPSFITPELMYKTTHIATGSNNIVIAGSTSHLILLKIQRN